MKKHLNTIYIGILILGLVGCGDPKGDKKEESSSATNFPQSPAGAPAPLTPDPTKGTPDGTSQEGVTQAELKALLGNFQGYVYKQSSRGTLAQAYFMQVTTSVYQGNTYLQLDLRVYTDHTASSIAFESRNLMGMYIEKANTGRALRFVSSVQRQSALYGYPISIEYTYFGANQYSLGFKDCSFSSTQECLYPAKSIWADAPARLQ
jgi:hypothetical protein